MATAAVEDKNGVAVFAAAMKMLPEDVAAAKYKADAAGVYISLPWHNEAPDKIELYPAVDGVIKNGSKLQYKLAGSQLQIIAERGNAGLADVWPLVLRIDGKAYSSSAAHDAALFFNPNAGSETSLFMALLFAWLGGIILNAMPCVFPILSLKALSLARSSGKSDSHAFSDAIAYTAGVVLSFAVMAAILIALKTAGNSVGWGFQMQSPLFVAVMAILLFLIGLSLSGVFHLPSFFAGGALQSEHKILTSFATGAMATAVATPCTAPFMAGAIGFAITQEPFAAIMIFVFLGLGLATPYALIVTVPWLRNRLPKSGRWLETFKQFLAFPMYASSAWLVWVLSQQIGSDGLAAVMAAIILSALLVWAWPLVAGCKFISRFILRAGLLALIALALYMQPADTGAPRRHSRG
jgi:thiol:disulfide interchange protein DsbD